MKNIIIKNKKVVTIAGILHMLTSLMLVLTSLQLSKLLNAIVAKDVQGLIRQSVIIIEFWVVTFLLHYGSNIKTAKAIANLNITLRSQMTDKLINMDYEKFNSEETASYVTWLTNDVNQIENTAFNEFFKLISQISLVIFSLCGLVSLHFSIAIIAIVLCAIMIVIPKSLDKTIQKDSSDMSHEQEEFVKTIKETIMGHEVLYSYNLLSRLKENILSNSKTLEEKKCNFKKTQALVNILISLSNVISQLIMIAVSGYLSVKGLTSIGAIFPASTLAGTFFNSISILLNSKTTIKSAKPIFKKLDFKTNETKDLKECPEFSSAIKFKDVNFGYGDRIIFNDVSFIFEKGKKYAITGPSGSGKTTLVKLILGHLKGYEGDITIDEEDIKQYSEQSIRNNFAYIGENVYTFSGTLRDNITLKENFTEEELNKAIEESCLNDFVSSAKEKLDTFIEEKNISGGQKQRIAIARALIRNKPVIIIDEGTSALDKRNALEVESRLLKNPDVTVILITHHLNVQLSDDFDHIFKIVSQSDLEVSKA